MREVAVAVPQPTPAERHGRQHVWPVVRARRARNRGDVGAWLLAVGMRNSRHGKGRTLPVILASGILIAIAAGGLFVFWPQIYSFYEEEMIWAKKAAHWHRY